MMLYCLQQIGFYSYKMQEKQQQFIEVTQLDICSFQERVGKPFIRLIKDNISNWFRSSSKDVLSAFSIFDPKKVPSLSTHELPLYGDISIQTLIGQFGRDLPAKSLEELNLRRQPLSLLASAERKTYRQLLNKQPNDDISIQLTELLTNDMHIAVFPNLRKLATICLSIPISTASTEQSFSDMKLIKNRLRNNLTELSLSNLMKIVNKSPEKKSLIVICKK